MQKHLAHLSQRLKRAFLIKVCPLSIIVVVIVVVVKFSHFRLLLLNDCANLNRTSYKAVLDKENSILFNEGLFFSRGDNNEIMGT